MEFKIEKITIITRVGHPDRVYLDTGELNPFDTSQGCLTFQFDAPREAGLRYVEQWFILDSGTSIEVINADTGKTTQYVVNPDGYLHAKT